MFLIGWVFGEIIGALVAPVVETLLAPAIKVVKTFAVGLLC